MSLHVTENVSFLPAAGAAPHGRDTVHTAHAVSAGDALWKAGVGSLIQSMRKNIVHLLIAALLIYSICISFMCTKNKGEEISSTLFMVRENKGSGSVLDMPPSIVKTPADLDAFFKNSPVHYSSKWINVPNSKKEFYAVLYKSFYISERLSSLVIYETRLNGSPDLVLRAVYNIFDEKAEVSACSCGTYFVR